MKLYYGATSSFSQKVRAAAIECGVADRIELILIKTMNHDPALARHNPLVKVPALITDDGFALFDSPVICEYLDSLQPDHRLIPPSGQDRWRVLRRQALGDGLMESLIFIGVAARRPERAQFYLKPARSHARSIRTLRQHCESKRAPNIQIFGARLNAGMILL